MPAVTAEGVQRETSVSVTAEGVQRETSVSVTPLLNAFAPRAAELSGVPQTRTK